MYSSSRLLLKYILYHLSASSGKGHGIHSPFVFDFIANVLNDKHHYDEYDLIERMRRELRLDQTILNVEDFGAGSSRDKTNRRSISSIASHASKPSRYGQLLFRMVRHYQPSSILELGTSLGITTAYLAAGNPTAGVITMEGAKSVVEKARDNFDRLQLPNISIIGGRFEDTLVQVLDRLPKLDFAFIDGNHLQDPTEKYYQLMASRTHNDSILVFDDIHWSKGMENAWQNIRHHASVRCSIDLFFIGILLFRQEFFQKQHFTIRF